MSELECLQCATRYALGSLPRKSSKIRDIDLGGNEENPSHRHFSKLRTEQPLRAKRTTLQVIGVEHCAACSHSYASTFLSELKERPESDLVNTAPLHLQVRLTTAAKTV